MLLRRLAAPALLGLAIAGCKGEPVASANTGALDAEQRANVAMRLVDAAGTGDGAAGAGLAASVIMSGAPVTRVTATRNGFGSVARVGETNDLAADVVTTAEGAVYNVIAFQMIERTFDDTTMGIVAWDATSNNEPTSFVVAYAFGEGTGRFDTAAGGPTAYGYVFESGNGSCTATSGSASLLRKTVGTDCDGFQYPGVSALCRLATFTGELEITGSAPLGAGATGSPTLTIQSTPLNGIMIEVTPTTAAAIARRTP